MAVASSSSRSWGRFLNAFFLGAAILLASTTAGVVLAQQNCGGSCKSLNDCAGQLICISGRCNDDPDVGTHICSGGSGGGSGGAGTTCRATSGNSGTCCSSNTCHKTSCSPPVSPSGTQAILTVNGFQQGEDGGGPSECDNRYHNDADRVVALSTGWYNKGSRCLKQIRIQGNGRTTTATVVDECDSQNGCDSQHAGQPPCANNIVDGSSAVWQALGVSTSDSRYGYMHVTWEDV